MSIFKDKTEMPPEDWAVYTLQCPAQDPRQAMPRLATDKTELKSVVHVARPRKGHAY